jgi:hypothetical protein
MGKIAKKETVTNPIYNKGEKAERKHNNHANWGRKRV